MNAVVKTHPTADRDAILREIADTATNMVIGAHRIGVLLNTAKATFEGDDKSWGQWRDRNVCDDLGITNRTCQRMQQLAEKWPSTKTMPQCSLSVLYILCAPSTEPSAQEEIVETMAEQNGHMTVNQAERINIRHRKARKAVTNGERQRVEPERVNGEGGKRVKLVDPAVVEHNLAEGNDEHPNAPVPPRRRAEMAKAPAAPVRDPAEVQVDIFLNAVKGKSPKVRAQMLAYLMAEMKMKGLLDVDDECNASFVPSGRKGRIELSCK